MCLPYTFIYLCLRTEFFKKNHTQLKFFNSSGFPLTKTCSCCDHVKENLSLEERTWTCSKCNTIHDRDVNASKNILRRALAIQSAGTVDYRNGAKVRPKEISKVSGGTGDEVLKKMGRIYTLKPVGL
jgi:putative transposase